MQKEWKKQYPPGTKEIIVIIGVHLNSTRELKESWEHSEYAGLSYDEE